MPSRLTLAARRLAAQQARTWRAKLGPPLALSDADLDRMAEVGPLDTALAEAFLRDAAGQKAVDLFKSTRE
jgi:hypothetical protein